MKKRPLKLVSINADSLPVLHGDVVRRQCARDEFWFQQNPKASHRDRSYRTGELGPQVKLPTGTQLRVWRIGPFLFARLPLSNVDYQERGRR